MGLAEFFGVVVLVLTVVHAILYRAYKEGVAPSVKSLSALCLLPEEVDNVM